jgi:hypothetical protein
MRVCDARVCDARVCDASLLSFFYVKGFYKVLRHESAPDYCLDCVSRKDYMAAKRLYQKAGVIDQLPYDYDALAAARKADRLRAAALRGGLRPPPPREHLRELSPTYNAEMGITLTPGKGHWGDHGRWVDAAIFRHPPRYRQKVDGVDNEREERMHFERLEELRFQRETQARMRLASCPPQEWVLQFKAAFSQFDLQGLPTHDRDGNALSTDERRQLEEAYERHLQVHSLNPNPKPETLNPKLRAPSPGAQSLPGARGAGPATHDAARRLHP